MRDIIIITILAIVALALIFAVLKIFGKPAVIVAGGTATAPALTPATVVTPVTAPPPARVTTVVTPCPTRQGSDWLGGFVKFMWGLLQVVFVIAIITVLLVGLWLGGLWAKNWIDNWVRQDDCGTQELVVVRPGIYTTKNLNGFYKWEFMPPVSTLVEYFDQSGRPIPVECNGVLAYSIVSQPGINHEVSASNELQFLRMSSADPSYHGEYSFVIKLE
jgi:hypothetical protein